MARAVFVYPNPRSSLIAAARRGDAPSTNLLGLLELPAYGLDAAARDSALDTRASFLPKRLRWHLRELTLPWEVGEADVVVTPLANVMPLAARVRRLPTVVFAFGLNTILRRCGRVRRAALAASLPRASSVVCLGESQRRELVARSGLEPARTSVVLHGVDHRFFTPQARRERLVVAVGRDPARDYATLASAAREVDAQFVFVAAVARNLSRVALPPNVAVRESISWSELRELYARAACAVVPLEPPESPLGSEGSGITALLEAQASGLPVVATDRPIIREYVTDGGATLVPPYDAPTLAAAVTAFVDDPARAAEAGAAARRHVEERHTMDHMAERLAPIVRAAAAIRRPR